ncbi:MAG TPA: hypothetical protein VF765_22720 [Polyangiaceae bacterium]
MRFVFHAMLVAAVAIVLVGLGCGSAEWATYDAVHLPAHATLHRGVHERLPIEATIAPPIAIVPRYGDAVASGTTLVWRLTEGTDGARVELSPTPDFDPARTRVIDVDGDRMRLPAGLRAGAWYWRLRGESDGVVGARATPTWMLVVAQPQAESADWG